MRAVVHDDAQNSLTYSEAFENADGKDEADVDGQRDETVATMEDFLSQLTMRIYKGEELIYESSPDEAGALADNVFIGALNPGPVSSGWNLTFRRSLTTDMRTASERWTGYFWLRVLSTES